MQNWLVFGVLDAPRQPVHDNKNNNSSKFLTKAAVPYWPNSPYRAFVRTLYFDINCAFLYVHTINFIYSCFVRSYLIFDFN